MCAGALLFTVTSLAAITGIATAWLIAGGAALSLPIAAHLLSRRPARIVEFPGVRFVMRAASVGAGRRRVRDSALLTLRCLLVAAIALAFARPSWTGTPASMAVGGAVDLVIVLDASASMMRVDRGRTLFDVARDEAVELLDDLDPSRDRAAVVLARLTPSPALPELTGNIEALRSRLARAGPTLEHADIADAIALARTFGADGAGEGRMRRIVVVSDMQRGSWRGAGGAGAQGVAIRSVAPARATANIAVEDLQVVPARPVAGERVEVSASLRSFGAGPDAAAATLRIGDRREVRRVEFDESGSGAVMFETVFPVAGAVAVSIGIDDESFRHDDVAGAVVDVAPRRRVRVVSGGGDGGAAPYLAAALSPDAMAAVEVASLGAERLGSEDVSGLDALFIVGAGRLDDSAIGAIDAHLGRGGGVVWFADSGEAVDSIMRAAELSPSVLSPIEFIEDFAVHPDGYGLDSFPDPSPALRGLAGTGVRAMEAPRFTAFAPGRIAAGAQTLLRYEDGAPFAASANAGGGTLIVVNADIAPKASNLTRTLLFPALAHELLAYTMRSAPMRPVIRVGEPVEITLPLDQGFVLSAPLRDGRGRIVDVSESGGAVRLRAHPVEAPGFVRIIDSDGVEIAGAFAALDPRQSDTGAIDPDRVPGAADEGAEAAAAGASGALSSRDESIELWPLLLSLAIGIALLESLVAAGAGRSRRVKEPRP